MIYQEQHEAFKKLMIQQGISQLAQLDRAFPFGCTIAPTRIDRWFNRLMESPTEFCSQRRYVNHFKLGADPEFVFSKNGARIDARNFNLAQGLAFGMDNNGRLIEIRPYPSRSAMNVVASILAAMRWLAILHPDTVGYDWSAGAFLFGDGLGGHVHFGRKRPHRDLEVKALDALDDEFMAIKAYPAAEVARRRLGDEHHQLYGHHGDIRKQMHGYEYRTFPSWLDSPELAFLTITLAKLVVHNPSLAQGYAPLPNFDRHFQRVRNLLAYYKDTDDDARLALAMLSRRLPVHVGGDFKKRWGIEPTAVAGPAITFIPSCIKPGADDIKEMFDYLAGKGPLTARTPVPTWSPLMPPNGYTMVIQKTQTWGAKGLGELLWDICASTNFKYNFANVRHQHKKAPYFTIPTSLANMLQPGWQKFCQGKITIHEGDAAMIYSTEKFRDALTFMQCRRLLLETVFPFWRIGDVKADSWQQWRGSLRTKPTRSKWDGRVLLGDEAGLPLVRSV
jgi:Phage phiEco32-like COOH.NH2 ligase-type 2